MEELTYRQASRFLDMATMGIREGEVEALLALGSRSAWIDSQLLAPFASHEERTVYQQQQRGEALPTQEMRVCAWFDVATYTEAQLRQRVAFALSQILVVGDRDPQLAPYPIELAHYYDLLTTYAFSDYKTLLYHVTRSPIMGHFLTMVGNLPKAQSGVDPDQNYAREVMQLFSIGLEALNMDGSKQVDSEGNPIQLYDDDTIQNVARVFTGWFTDGGSMREPMLAFDDSHDLDPKQILGVSFPAGVGAEAELDQFLDILVNHPSTAPNISTLLIKRLVTSNPRPAFIERVATVFANTNGNLGEVVKAILTDPETLNVSDDRVAKVREPILAMTYLIRAMDCKPGESSPIIYDSINFRESFNQYPLGAPSVFNFFSPEYTAGEVAQNGLRAPELQIVKWDQLINFGNVIWKMLHENGTQKNSNSRFELYPNVSPFVNVVLDYPVLTEALAKRLFHGDVPTDIAPRWEGLWNAKSEKNKPSAIGPMLFVASMSHRFMVQE